MMQQQQQQQQQPVSQPQGGALAPNQMVVTEPTPSIVSVKDRACNWTGIKVTGGLQIACGILTVILGIASAAVNYSEFVHQQYALPIWCGLLFFSVAGIVGILASLKRNKKAVVAYLVASIIAVIMSVVLGRIIAGNIAFTNGCENEHKFDFCLGEDIVPEQALLLIMSVAEFVVAIVGASMTCGIVCCSAGRIRSRSRINTVFNRDQTQVIFTAQPNVYATGQFSPQQQYAYPMQQPAGATAAAAPIETKVALPDEFSPPAYDAAGYAAGPLPPKMDQDFMKQ